MDFTFAGRRGNIIGWIPHANEEQDDVDGALLLSKMPVVIYVHSQEPPGVSMKASTSETTR